MIRDWYLLCIIFDNQLGIGLWLLLKTILEDDRSMVSNNNINTLVFTKAQCIDVDNNWSQIEYITFKWRLVYLFTVIANVI